MYEKLAEAARYIHSIKATSPQVGIILGSGLGIFVDAIENKTIIPYQDIPFFKSTTVEGHQGRLILGHIAGTEVAILQGRLHGYEGLNANEIVFPVRTLATLGVEALFLTNAAGGIDESFKPGDLILIDDHINLMGQNPLVGPNMKEFGPRFPDMTQAYNPELKKCLQDAAAEIKYTLKRGVYAALLGPTYETPAEVRMLRTLGADMVGMSTVPESIAANHLGLKVCGISCITNMAAGITSEEIKHEDVNNQALKVMKTFSLLLKTAIEKAGQLNA